ncbi:putative reverse transcriptase domain-containing protein, partial [Tanacetum coccineum]
MRMISKDGTISEFPGYTSSKEEEDEEEDEGEEEEEEKEESEKKRSKEESEIGSNSKPPGYAAIDNDVESDLESTARSEPNGPSNDENPDIAAIIAQQLQTILPEIVTQVTNNVNNANANGGNGGNNGCSYKTFLACNPRVYDGKGGAVALTRGREAALGMSWVDFKALLVEEFCPRYTARFPKLAKLVPHLVTPKLKRIERYINGLAPQIRGMLRATKPTMIQSAILKARILTDEAIRCGTLTRSSEKRKEVEETSKQGGSWKDNKKAKVGKGFVVIAPPRNENVDSYPKCAKCSAYHPEGGPCRQVAPISAVRMENNQRVYYECGSSVHIGNTCPKNRAPGQAGNRLALEGNRNTQNNGNQARGRAFSVNAVDALHDLNVVTGTFSLNDHFATVIFNSGANFSFISTKFSPLLNVKPSIVSPGYIIEVANGKKEEVDRIICDCKLELGNSLFTIDLIPLGHGSFDVIVGMD